MKEKLFGKTQPEITEIVQKLGLPKFTASQLTGWLYKKHISSITDMTNLSVKARGLLEENYCLGTMPFSKVEESSDGTKKYLFAAHSNKFIETAMIPANGRNTVCISSQVGCKMGCHFCMTAKQGFQGQLTVGEILNQIHSIDEAGDVSNIVYMGMGEPFDNIGEVLKSIDILTSEWGYAMSPRRITVSSIGVIPGMLSFLEKTEANLAISLHTPFAHERQKIMPLQAAYPISDVIQEIKKWDFGGQRRVSFEYIMFKDFNDSRQHIKEIVKLLNGIKCRVNLIRFHPVPGISFESSPDNTIQEFKDALNKKGVLTTIRASRGQDINAACGLLSTKGHKP